MLNPSRRLGELLVERKVLSRESLEVALQREAAEGRPLPAILVSEGLVGEKDLVAAIAAQVGKRFVDLQSTFISPELDRMVPPELAVQHLAVAVELDGDHLVVAMENPGDSAAVQLLEQATGFQVKPGLAVRSELQRVVTAMYGLPSGGSA